MSRLPPFRSSQCLVGMAALALGVGGCSGSATSSMGPVERYLSTVPPLTHGEPPHRELRRYDYDCAPGRYQLIIEQTMSSDRSQWSVAAKSVTVNGRLLAMEDRRRLAEALSEYAALSSVNVLCWPNGVQVFLEGRRQQSRDTFRLIIGLGEEGLGRIDRLEGADRQPGPAPPHWSPPGAVLTPVP